MLEPSHFLVSFDILLTWVENANENKEKSIFIWYFAHLIVPLTSSKVLRYGNVGINKKVMTRSATLYIYSYSDAFVCKHSSHHFMNIYNLILKFVIIFFVYFLAFLIT